MKIYVVEDDPQIRELEMYALESSGFETEGFEEGTSFLHALSREIPALVLLDVMLPGESGLDILKKLRAQPETVSLPIILVTAKSSELDTVRGLDLGADDYISKPFGVMELVSRVKARTRHQKKNESVLRYGDIAVNEERHCVTVSDSPVELTYKEFELLVLLLRNTGRVLTRDQIMERIWGFDYSGSSRTLDMHIKTLRQKLGTAGRYIQTIRNVGYRIGD